MRNRFLKPKLYWLNRGLLVELKRNVAEQVKQTRDRDRPEDGLGGEFARGWRAVHVSERLIVSIPVKH
jgi:hypothetical protein